MIEKIELGVYIFKDYVEIIVMEGWVNYGDNNLFSDYLIKLYESLVVYGVLCNLIS